jgi:enoyl-CoA hydratase
MGSVRVERTGGVARCILDRPPLNLFEPTLISDLREAFASLARDPGLRLIVLGATGRAFTAGMDVRVLGGLDVESARGLITNLGAAIDAVHQAPVPVIAAIHGACLGAGFELALACDLRVAATDARFGLPEVRVGVPSVIHAALLPPLVGPGRAAELLLTGDTIGPEQALGWGLVSRVVEPSGLDGAVGELVGRIVSAGPAAVRLQKELIIRWRETDLPTAIRLSIHTFATAYAGDEPREGTRAFLEKRTPDFRRPR